ncbi:MAG: signal protein PDZ [Anaerolineaceae bacterium]|nr:signal protein PDZ [Anaerolineaceae bacterium]
MSDALQNLSDALANAVESASAGIVRVDGRRRLPGTGIVWSSDGVIVTAHHIIERNENISIGLPGDVIAPAQLIGRDPNTDVAVLKVEADTTAPVWADGADGNELKVGHLVLALGRPGEQVQATLGVVSKLSDADERKRKRIHVEGHGRRGGRGRGGRHMWYAMEGEMFGNVGPIIQTDVVMYPGFSGGPLIDATGAIRGLNTSALSRGSSVTIPTTTIRSVVEALLSHGKVRRGYLGIGAQPVRLPTALAEELDQEIGLMIVSVESGSPAETSGLLLGDIVVGLDDDPVQTIDTLLMLLSTDRVGQEAAVHIIRGGQLIDVTVTIGERE